MVVDLRFKQKSPAQVQKVRMITFYPKTQFGSSPEVVIQFDDNLTPQQNIPIKDIVSVTVTRD